MSPVSYPCPCCGYRTFAKPAGGTMQLCPVCAWEDASDEIGRDGSNAVDLLPVQQHFLATGACEDEYLNLVRSPLLEEARSERWMSYDDLRLRIIEDIEAEFHDVKRGGGVTLHQMWYLDGDTCESATMEVAGLNDPEVAWQDVSSDKLSKFSQSLAFMDEIGFRFYLPAFMRHVLATSSQSGGINQDDLDGVLDCLDGGLHSSGMHRCFAMLTDGQKRAVASFVFLVSIAGDEFQRLSGLEGLTLGWDAYVPDFLKLAIL